MTPSPNQALKAPPNVLSDQTSPNSLAGLGPPGAAPRRRLPVTALMAAGGVILAFVAVVLTRTA